jgi:hypothetical protein
MKVLSGILIILCMCCSTTKAQRIQDAAPWYLKVQYAGSIGFLSAGLGYGFFKNRISTEIIYGFVPETKGGPLDIATVRMIYNPFTIRITPSVSITPLTVSGFVTYHFGEEFYIKLPQQYYSEYYKWSSAIRYHAGFGSILSYHGKNSGHGFAFYYELNTNDLYVKSLRANSTLSIYDILSLGIGIKMY